MEKTPIISPCVSICDIENDYCVGCYRTIYEIENWYKMDDSQKIDVLRSVEARSQKGH